MISVSLSAIWVDDAQSRGLDIGTEVRRSPTGKMVELQMTDDQLAEAASDSRFYATDWKYMTECQRLGRSAQSAAKKLTDIQLTIYSDDIRASRYWKEQTDHGLSND